MGQQVIAIGRNKYEDALVKLQGLQTDADAFYGKGNKAAGTRVRQGILAVVGLLKEARVEVQGLKNKAAANQD